MLEHEPLFLLGNPRSGTSLLRLILTSHHHLCIPPECGFALWLQAKYAPDNTWTATRIDEFVDDVVRCRKFETWQLDRGALRDHTRQHRPRSYSEAVSLIYDRYRIEAGKPSARWGDKNNHYVRRVPEIQQLFPQAKLLHLVRDPRDVACSYRELRSLATTSPYAPRLPYEAAEIARQWVSNVECVRDACGTAPHDNAMVLRYEDLVSQPERSLDRICDWLDIGFESNMLDFHQVNRDDGLEPKLTLDWKLKTLQPIDSASVGRFTESLTRSDESTILSIAKPVMQAFGYE